MTAIEFIEAFNELCEQEQKAGVLDEGELQALLNYQKDCLEWMSRECWNDDERLKALHIFEEAIRIIKIPGAVDIWTVLELRLLKPPDINRISFIYHYTSRYFNFLDEYREMYNYEKEYFSNPLKVSKTWGFDFEKGHPGEWD